MHRIYHITVEPSLIDILQALISNEIDTEGISYEDEGFSFYINASMSEDQVNVALDNLKSRFSFEYKSTLLEDKNWNAIWEADFQAVEVENYCRISAPFHEPNPSFLHDIIVHPGMAFGTGHHETTWMMVRMMKDLSFQGKKVLDAGCGTGVLAILAVKENASHVDAFDYDINSVESSINNMALNNIDSMSVTQSTVSDFNGLNYDIICANINRNVILKSLEHFKKMLSEKGMIVVSGYLEVDKSLVEAAAQKNGFTLRHTSQRGEWICQVYKT